MNHFSRAITRSPGFNFAQGITTAQLGAPDFERASAQHAAYCQALRMCGIELTLLPADDRYPDGCFVEDTAIVTEAVAVITRPGDPTRRGETERIAALLAEVRPIESILAPGCVDGGDILRVGDHFYIGQSQRTNAAGAAQLSTILARYGYTSATVPVAEVLHLKTGITYLGDATYIAIAACAEHFAAHDPIVLPPDEAYAANCLRVNDHVLVPSGYPTAERELRARGFELLPVEMTEFAKMDGGLTCLSLLW